MIYKRVAARLRAQDWVAITIELTIVIVGVFIGTWVANRNQERVERREAQQMVRELQPGLRTAIASFVAAKDYLATARAYSDTAFAAWDGDPKVSDEQFVIAAYQASQITQVALNAVNWTEVYGGSSLHRLSDPSLRRDLAVFMTLDFSQLAQSNIATSYRQDVRQVIPQDIQDAIRSNCGDYYPPDKPMATQLPPTCDLDFPPERWAAAARDLRAEPQLVKELRWHRAAVASYVDILALFADRAKLVLVQINA